jgi:hypothetical protein
VNLVIRIVACGEDREDRASLHVRLQDIVNVTKIEATIEGMNILNLGKVNPSHTHTVGNDTVDLCHILYITIASKGDEQMKVRIKKIVQILLVRGYIQRTFKPLLVFLKKGINV